MKSYTKEKLLELLRKSDFPEYATDTCLTKAFQDFIFNLSEVIDTLCASKKARFTDISKLWIDSETISTIHKSDKLFKSFKKFGLETDKDIFFRKW